MAAPWFWREQNTAGLLCGLWRCSACAARGLPVERGPSDICNRGRRDGVFMLSVAASKENAQPALNQENQQESAQPALVENQGNQA